MDASVSQSPIVVDTGDNLLAVPLMLCRSGRRHIVHTTSMKSVVRKEPKDRIILEFI